MWAAGVFVPGLRSLTNKMLSDLRAAGKYEANAIRAGRVPMAGHDRFAAENAAIRLLTKRAWLELFGVIGKPEEIGGISVDVYVVGHRRFDPDAHALLVKPAIDGMADALRVRDKAWLCEVSGRVAQKEGEARRKLWSECGGSCFGETRTDRGVPGFWMDAWAP